MFRNIKILIVKLVARIALFEVTTKIRAKILNSFCMYAEKLQTAIINYTHKKKKNKTIINSSGLNVTVNRMNYRGRKTSTLEKNSTYAIYRAKNHLRRIFFLRVREREREKKSGHTKNRERDSSSSCARAARAAQTINHVYHCSRRLSPSSPSFPHFLSLSPSNFISSTRARASRSVSLARRLCEPPPSSSHHLYAARGRPRIHCCLRPLFCHPTRLRAAPFTRDVREPRELEFVYVSIVYVI